MPICNGLVMVSCFIGMRARFDSTSAAIGGDYVGVGVGVGVEDDGCGCIGAGSD